nr:MAG TPA: hypothetical protein [Caudoviricetes sp.]
MLSRTYGLSQYNNTVVPVLLLVVLLPNLQCLSILL